MTTTHALAAELGDLQSAPDVAARGRLPRRIEDSALDARNEELLERVNATGEKYLSRAVGAAAGGGTHSYSRVARRPDMGVAAT